MMLLSPSIRPSTTALAWCFLGFSLLIAPAAARAQTPAPPADSADVASIDAIIGALYDVISGPAGEERDWDRLRSLFRPGARLIPTSVRESGEVVMRPLTVEEYIETSGPYLVREGFFEQEIGRETDRFGQIAQVFSSYESRHALDDQEPFMRGINSIQLLNDGERWWVVNVYWANETPGRPIPEQYVDGNRR